MWKPSLNHSTNISSMVSLRTGRNYLNAISSVLVGSTWKYVYCTIWHLFMFTSISKEKGVVISVFEVRKMAPRLYIWEFPEIPDFFKSNLWKVTVTLHIRGIPRPPGAKLKNRKKRLDARWSYLTPPFGFVKKYWETKKLLDLPWTILAQIVILSYWPLSATPKSRK